MKVVVLIFALLSSLQLSACPAGPDEITVTSFRGFGASVVGENHSGISEEEFQKALSRVVDHYRPAFKEQGREVTLSLDWLNPTANALTGQMYKRAEFYFFGGLARAKYMTTDGLMFVACHEVGHHLGGLPLNATYRWATSEGGSDYFGAMKCMREILSSEEMDGIEVAVDERVREKCRDVHSDPKDFQICLRTVKAGDDVFQALRWSRTKSEEGTLLFQELPAVTETNTNHPAYACRAETVFQGALCVQNLQVKMSYINEHEGACHEANGDLVGLRPNCWYKSAER